MFNRNAHTRAARPFGPDAATLIAKHEATTAAYLATIDRTPASALAPATCPLLVPAMRPAVTR